MKNFIAWFLGLFKSSYGPFTLLKEKEIKVAITETVEDETWSHGLGISDPIDTKEIPTGRFYTKIKQTWVAYHLKTGLPKYKQVYI